MTFFTFLRFTKQQNMLQQQLKEATVGTKTLKAQPYLELKQIYTCLLYTSPSPRDGLLSRMPSSA